MVNNNFFKPWYFYQGIFFDTDVWQLRELQKINYSNFWFNANTVQLVVFDSKRSPQPPLEKGGLNPLLFKEG
jgi:hypothetical protein